MAFPESWTRVLVTGKYVLANGVPARGKVEFSVYPPRRIVSAEDGTVVIPETLVAELDQDGGFSMLVPATDDPDIHPHFAWHVRESFLPNKRFNYYVEISHDLETLDISHALEVEQEQPLVAHVRRSGDRMTGYLTLHADPTLDLHAATKRYVDTKVDEAIDLIPEYVHQTVTYQFFTPAGTWLINHNFGRYPQVSILDSGDVVVDADIIHNSLNQLIVVFAQPQMGKAVLT